MASLPYPRRPLNNSPTDGTDAHRWFGCVGFSHGIHRIHRNFWQRRASHGFHRCSQIRRVWHPCHTHATLCQSSHRIHRIHRSFWRKIFSHGFRRCPQMVRLRRVLWEDSLVGAWVWQGCHTLRICAHPCNLWENFALLVQLGQLHPLLGRCKKSIDFFVVTKFRCIFAM